MNNKIQEAINKEREIEKLISSAKEDLCNQVSKASTLQGVSRITNSPRCVAVSLKTLSENNHNWSPSTYIPESQAKAVESVIAPIKTASGFQNKVKDMVNTGRVKVKSETISLNTETIRILKNTLNDEGE